jgi:uncharacterized membrane protein
MKQLNQNNPISFSLIILAMIILINLLTHFLFMNYSYASLNYVMSAGFYGSILFPIYYTLTLIIIFILVYFYKAKAKIFIYILIFVYLLFSLPIINLDSLNLHH